MVQMQLLLPLLVELQAVLVQFVFEHHQVEFDKYVSAQVRMNEGDSEHFRVVKGRKRGNDGKFIGNYHENPFLDTLVYEVEIQY